MRWILPLMLALPLTLAAHGGKPMPSKGTGGKFGLLPDESIKVKGATRGYRLLVPNGISARKAVPLVFSFHGRGGSKDRMHLYCGLNGTAKQNKFILVYPSAIGGNWNLRPGAANADIAFFDALYTRLTKQYNIDLNRVYLTGMSMGGYFSNLVASQRSDKIAAIAPHSGGLGWLRMGVKVEKKYAVFVIHGDADRVVPVSQGRSSRDVYKRAGHKIEYLEVAGLGHRWATKQRINDKIWKFFVANPRK